MMKGAKYAREVLLDLVAISYHAMVLICVQMEVWLNLIKGKCYVENSKRKCECEPGWEGDYCSIVSCQNYDICGLACKNLLNN